MTQFAQQPATIKLGDLEVCRLGFGAMQLTGPMVWGEPRDPDAARAVLRRVVALGIQLIDTSWYYGPHVPNRLIAETLYPYPKDLVLATKLGGKRTPDKGWAAALSPQALREGCEEDLRGLRRERIDVVHLRLIHNEVPFLESLDAMIALQREGKIRHLALSNVSLAELQQALQRTKLVGVQNLYNVSVGERQLGTFPHAAVKDQEAIVDLCAAQGMAFLPFFPLTLPGPARPPSAALTRIAQQRAVTPAQLAIAWLLARSPALLPIPGTSSVAHLEENWAAREIALSAEEFAAISAARA
jgi:aryl-alcohol dehydrogenase-like predicted oxidoreductase